MPPRPEGGEGFSLPPIRTMADDLADVTRGALSGTGNLPASSPSQAVPAPTPVPPHAPGKLVRLPAETVRPRSRVFPVLLSIFGLLLLVGIGTWAVFRFLPSASGTVADAIPGEAQAFVSVRTDDAQSAALRAALVSAVGRLTEEQLRGATDLTYVLLPGPSAAEPVAALLVRGVQTVDLSATPDLGVKPLADGILITESANLGRVNALSGSTWGRDRSFRSTLRGFPDAPPILLAFRPGALATLLQPFAPHPLPAESPLVMAIVPQDDGSASVVARVGSASGRGEQSSSAPAGSDALLRKLPRATVLSFGRPVTILGSLGSPAAADRIPSSLRPVLQALGERSGAFNTLLQSFEGTLALGVLPTDTAGVRDLVAVVPLKAGSDPRPQLRELESIGPAFGPYLTGSAFADAAFSESDYRDVRIRFMNFGTPSRALDYAIVDQDLFLATSRAAMRALIDAARGETPFAEAEPLAETVEGSSWVVFRSDPRLQEEFPPAYRALTNLFDVLFLRPAGLGLLTGTMVLREPAPNTPAVVVPTTPDSETPAPTVQPSVP